MNIYAVTLAVPSIGTITVTIGAISPTAAMAAAQAQYSGSSPQTVRKISGQ